MRDAATAGGPRRALRSGIALVVGAIALFAGCGPQPLAPPQQRHELVVAVRPGPASWFPGADGSSTGFDHDLLTRFAREQNLPLRVVIVENAAALLGEVAAGKVHVGAGGLFQGAPAKDDGRAQSGDVPPQVLWSAGTHAVEPVLIYNRDGFKPKSFADLEGATVAYPEGTGLDAQLAAARLAHPEVTWKAVDVPSSDALIAQVADGTIDYAVVPSNDAAVAHNIYLDFAVAFPAGPRRLLAWAVAPGQRALRDAIDGFLNRLRGDGALARYAERYFAPVQRVQRVDGEVFRERIKSVLPQYQRDFELAQGASGIDWRLLAAVAYQESQWDPFATSETGVRGLMQLTEETARQLRVADRLDARASIGAAGRYLRELKAKLPGRITEPDRTWLALAAFNIGVAHLEDARILAQKQKLNPDLWSDVRKALPLLAQPEYYADAKYGYARGGMPVAFVDRVRAYYDILLRLTPPSQARLQLNADAAPAPR